MQTEQFNKLLSNPVLLNNETVDELKALGIAENTLLVAMADNGPMVTNPPPGLGMTETIFTGGKGDHTKSPVYEYKMDYFTVVSNCLGVPNLTVPLFESQEAKTKYDNFPSSIRLMGHFGEDFHLLRIG